MIKSFWTTKFLTKNICTKKISTKVTAICFFALLKILCVVNSKMIKSLRLKIIKIIICAFIYLFFAFFFWVKVIMRGYIRKLWLGEALNGRNVYWTKDIALCNSHTDFWNFSTCYYNSHVASQCVNG